MTSTLFNEESDTYYDSVYSKSLRYKQRPKHPDLKHYYPSWKSACDYIKLNEIKLVIDIGCGPGHLVVKLLELKKDVTALDIAPNMLEITQMRVDSMNLESEFKTILGDYSEHNFDEKFDAISVMGFFDYVEDPVSVLKKLLNDAAKEIYISIPGDSGFLAWQRKVRYKRRNCPLYLYSRESIEQYLKEAGCFEITEIVDTERGYYLIIRK